MWQQHSCYEQTNVVDVTIQCQLNVATKNVTEFSTMYGTPPPSFYYQHQPPTYQQTTNQAFPARTPPSTVSQCLYGNASPTKPSYQCEFEARQRSSGDFVPAHSFGNYEGFISDSVHFNLGPQRGYPYSGYSPSAFGYPSCMNDSGYGSPQAQPAGVDKESSFAPCVEVSRLSDSGSPVFEAVKHTSGGVDLSHQLRDSAGCDVTSDVDSDAGLSEEMKIAMREKDIMQRLFELGEKDSDSAREIEHFYHAQTSAIDIERHNVLSQMSYDSRSSDSIHQYYNRKLLSLLECVDERLTTTQQRKCKGIKGKLNNDKKSRLLPKHAVKIMQNWYDENLENPYPSREVTLSMASEGNVTVEQIRKWFANKRNRSRNNKLKAGDMQEDDS